MTRKEQIEKAAEDFAGTNYDIETKADSLYHYVQKEAFSAGAEWADQTMLDKVCKWLEEHLLLDDPKWYVEGEKTLQEKMINDLRKAMEE